MPAIKQNLTAKALTKTEKHRLAKAFLHEQMEGLEPGEMLPSVQTLIDSSGLTRTVISKALKYFIDHNLLEVRPRSGIYVAGPAENASGNNGQEQEAVRTGIIDVVACGEVNCMCAAGEYFPDFMEHFYLQASERNRSVRLYRAKLKAPASLFREIARQADSDVIILINPHLLEMDEIFGSIGKPVVKVTPKIPFSGGMQIVDSPEMMPLIMRHLLELGHRRIGFLNEVDPGLLNLTHLQRREDYYRIMSEHGLQTYPHWNLFCGYAEKDTFAALEEMFGREPVPTAVAAFDQHLPSVYRFLERKGYRIGQDIAVMGGDGLPVSEKLYPQASTVLSSRIELAGLIWKAIEDFQAGRPVPEKQSVTPKLIVRESTCPPPEE